MGRMLPAETVTVLDEVRSRRERNAGWQYLVGLVFFLVATIVGGIAGAMVNGLVHGEFTAEAVNRLWPGVATGLFLQAVLSVLGYQLMMRWLARRPAYELGRPRLGELACGLGLGAALVSLAVGLVALLGGYRVDGVQFGVGLLTGLAIGVGAGFAEEIFFRGVLLRLIDKQLGSWWAIGLTSVLFGALHLGNPGASAWGAIAITIQAGLMLGAAYLLTRRLWFAIGIHVGWNLVQSSIFSINVSGSGYGSGGLLQSRLEGPVWLSGGEMGIEGSVICVLIGLVAGVWLLVLAYRRGQLLPRVRVVTPN